MFVKIINFLILLIVFNNQIFSQTITLGYGNQESSNYSSSPVNIYYRSTVCQFVYTSSELQAAGASTTAPITQLGFFVTQSPIYNIPGFTIKLKHVTQNNVATALGTTGWTTVKNSFSYSPTAGNYDMLLMDNGFTWNGVDNIGVEICWDQVTPTWNPSGKIKIYSTTEGYRYSWTDVAASSCGTIPLTTSNDKPQIQMIFIPGTQTVWTGNISSDWFNSDNWTVGIPTPTMDALIPNGTVNLPIISDGQIATTKNIEIENNAKLTINGTNELEVYGNWINQGNIDENNSTIYFKGNGITTTLSGATGQRFYNLNIFNQEGVSIIGGSYEVQGSLYLTGGTFTTGNRITLLSNTIETSRIPRITTPCLYTLNMTDTYGDSWNGGYINILINGNSIGTFACSGSATTETFFSKQGETIELIYTGGSFENENQYELLDPNSNQIFTDGPNPAVGNVFTTTSNCSFTNPFSGNITTQRYIDAGQTNWRFLTHPVAGADLEQFDDDFITSGFPGTDFPNWPSAAAPWSSMFLYNETNGITFNDGFTVPTNTSYALSPGEGVWVWCGDTSTGTQPFTIDASGPANVGPITLPTTYSNNGAIADNGWNMVANPYMCTIDWDATTWNKTNVEDAIYIWDPNNSVYASYIAGAGTNNGSNKIASSQAFWVKVNPGGSIGINESCKIDEDHTFLRTSNPDLLKLQLNIGNKSDETVIRFNSIGTDNYDANLDAKKIFNATASNLKFSNMYNGVEYSINTLQNENNYYQIPLKTITNQSSLAEIRATDLGSISGNCLILEDLHLGILTNLLIDSSYQFFINSADENRFVLHINSKIEFQKTDPSCHNFNDGQIELAAFGPQTSNYSILSPAGIVLNSNSGIFSNLEAGTYQILNNFCGSNQFVTLHNPLTIVNNIQVQNLSCATCCDAEIQLTTTGGTQPFNYNINNNYNSLSGLCAGVYSLTTTDLNGCSIHENIEISNVTNVFENNFEFGIYPNPSNGNFTLNFSDFNTVKKLNIVDVIGKVVYQNNSITKHSIHIDLSHLSRGLYQIIIVDNNNKKTQKELIIK